MRSPDAAPADGRAARVTIAARHLDGGHAHRKVVPRRDLHPGAELVHRKSLHQVGALPGGAVDQVSVALGEHEHVEQDFALRGEERGIGRLTLAQVVDVGREQVVQEMPRLRAPNR